MIGVVVVVAAVVVGAAVDATVTVDDVAVAGAVATVRRWILMQ